MNYLTKEIKKTFSSSTDLIIKNIKDITIIFLESLCSSDKINEYILKVLSLKKTSDDLNNILVGPNTKVVSTLEEITNL